MQIIFRIAYKFDREDQAELKKHGIAVALGFGGFDLREDDPGWPRIQSWIRRRNPVVTARTKFSAAELSAADHLEIGPTWHHGYPMPDDGGYKDVTYDRTKGCPACGVNWIQKSPFRMKSEPKWGKKHLLQLNWVFDEFFVIPEVFDAVFKQFGVRCQKVLHHKSGEPLQSVVQLRIDSLSEFPIGDSDLAHETCKQCRERKFHPPTRGPFPPVRGPIGFAIGKTQEFFGSGGSAWRAILISSEVYRAICDRKLKGIGYKPVGAFHCDGADTF